MECPKCKADLSEFCNFDQLLNIVVCPKCETELELNYDESWDPETGDEDSWWWFEIVKPKTTSDTSKQE